MQYRGLPTQLRIWTEPWGSASLVAGHKSRTAGSRCLPKTSRCTHHRKPAVTKSTPVDQGSVLRIRLVVKEHVEIPVLDTETHRGSHVVHPGHDQSLLASVVDRECAGGARDRLPPGTHHLDGLPPISPTTDAMVPAKS